MGVARPGRRSRRPDNWSPVDYAPHLWREYQALLLGYEWRSRAGEAFDAKTLADDLQSKVLPLGDVSAGKPAPPAVARWSVLDRLFAARRDFLAAGIDTRFQGPPEQVRAVREMIRLKNDLVFRAVLRRMARPGLADLVASAPALSADSGSVGGLGDVRRRTRWSGGGLPVGRVVGRRAATARRPCARMSGGSRNCGRASKSAACRRTPPTWPTRPGRSRRRKVWPRRSTRCCRCRCCRPSCIQGCWPPERSSISR